MSNKFLSNSTGTIGDGTENIYGSYVGASNLNPGSIVKVDGLKRLVSSEILISDITGLASTIASKLSNPSTRPITAPSFIKSGGLATQYLMADGSVTTSSGAGNSSNIYLYNSNTTLTTPPSNGQIRYNNAVQDNATEIYISHLTRDNLDIDEFLNLINDLSIIYIQDQNTSSNFIKYTVTATPTIVVNDYITIPVLKQSSDGTGSTNFPNGQFVFMSIFSNLVTVDNRLTTLEGKTQNQSLISGGTKFTGNLVADNIVIPLGTSTQILLGNGTTNSTALGNIAINTSNIATNTSNIATNTSNIATNTSNIATNTSNITSNTSNIATNTSNIATNTSNIATNTTALNNATSSNTIDTIVKRDGNGNFTGGIISGVVKLTAPKIQANNIVFSNAISTNLLGTDGDMSSITGDGNCTYGSQCGTALMGGLFNSYYGYRCGKTCTEGLFNVGVGKDACGSLFNGNGNSSLGHSSMYKNMFGHNNTAVGNYAMYYNSNSYNTALGYFAFNTNTQYDNTTSIGSLSEPDASNQVMLGDPNVTEVKSSGVFNGSGFKTPTGLSTDVLCANGSINSTCIPLVNTATNNNTINTIVKRDAAGNFSAGTITTGSIKIPAGTSSQILLANGTINSTALSDIASNISNITTLQTKTQNQTGTVGSTTFSGNLIGDNIKTPSGTSMGILRADGSVSVRTRVLSPNGDPFSINGVSNFGGTVYSVMSFYCPDSMMMTEINLHRSVNASVSMVVAIYNSLNYQIYTGSLANYTVTKFVFPVSPAVSLTGNSYYYFAVYSSAASMYGGQSAGATIVNSGLHASIQYQKVSFTGTSLPTTLPTSGGSISSVIYPPFQIIGY